jgi:hypothetical protein
MFKEKQTNDLFYITLLDKNKKSLILYISIIKHKSGKSITQSGRARATKLLLTNTRVVCCPCASNALLK